MIGKLGDAGRTFLTSDRKAARFLLRMREGAVPMDRKATEERLKSIVRKYGFEVGYVSGLYRRIGELTRLVYGSLWRSSAGLFAVIAFVTSRSVRWSLSMLVGLGAMTLCIFGRAVNPGSPRRPGAADPGRDRGRSASGVLVAFPRCGLFA